MTLSSFCWSFGPCPWAQALFKLSLQPISCLGCWESSRVVLPVPCLLWLLHSRALSPGLVSCCWPDPHMQSNFLAWLWSCCHPGSAWWSGLQAEPALLPCLGTAFGWWEPCPVGHAGVQFLPGLWGATSPCCAWPLLWCLAQDRFRENHQLLYLFLQSIYFIFKLSWQRQIYQFLEVNCFKGFLSFQ